LVLLDDTAPGGGDWSATTPRALAEPRLAAWAERRLGSAGNVVVHVAADGTRTTLDAAGLSALDVVYDSANARITASGLDAANLTARLRAALPGIGADPLPVSADPSWPAGTRAIGELAVQAASLGSLVAGSLPVNPAAFARPNDQPLRVADPSALQARLTPVLAQLTDAATALSDALAADPVDPVAVATGVDALRAFGIALPTSAGAIAVGPAVLAEARARLSAAASASAPFDAAGLGEAIFGKGFVVLTPVSGAADLFSAVFDGVKPGRAGVRRWLRDLATVRPGVARYAETLLLGDATGVASPLRVAQLAASGTAGTTDWLGLPMPADAASPDQPVTDVLVDAPPAYTGFEAVAGLVVDEWVEQLPRRDVRVDPAAPDVAITSASITTGLAVNANAPNARAPQAILLAVSPDGSRWSSDALVAVLRETRELASLRAVTLERQLLASPVLPAIQEQSWSLQGEPTLDLATLMIKISTVDKMLPYVKEAQ
jgi:hypothetical protein